MKTRSSVSFVLALATLFVSTGCVFAVGGDGDHLRSRSSLEKRVDALEQRVAALEQQG